MLPHLENLYFVNVSALVAGEVKLPNKYNFEEKAAQQRILGVMLPHLELCRYWIRSGQFIW